MAISFEREQITPDDDPNVWKGVMVDEIYDYGFREGKGPRIGVIRTKVTPEENERIINSLIRQAENIIARIALEQQG